MKSNSSEVRIRVAKPGDGAEIANVHLNSWREAYNGLLPDDYLSKMPLTFKRRMNYWNDLINCRPLGRQIWVAESERHGIVGFSTVENPRDEKFNDCGELGAIYLLKEYQRTGNGFALLKAAFSYLRESGRKRAYCWVLKNNPTISFYERTGAEIIDDIKSDNRGAIELFELACVWSDLSNF